MSPQCLFRVERATHMNLGNSRLKCLYFFHGCHVTEHVLFISMYENFRLFAFFLKLFSIDKCINKLFNNKVQNVDLYIHLIIIPKLQQINYCFVCMFIIPRCLIILTSKFFCFLYMLNYWWGKEGWLTCKQKNNLINAAIFE